MCDGDSSLHGCVGELDGEDQSSGVGIAPDNARPGGDLGPSRSSSSSRQEHPASSSRAAAGSEDGLGSSEGPMLRSLTDGPGGTEAALQAFKAGPGAFKVQLLNGNHAKMKAARKQAKDLALALNALKSQIDELKGQQEELKVQRLASGEDAAQVN